MRNNLLAEMSALASIDPFRGVLSESEGDAKFHPGERMIFGVWRKINQSEPEHQVSAAHHDQKAREHEETAKGLVVQAHQQFVDGDKDGAVKTRKQVVHHAAMHLAHKDIADAHRAVVDAIPEMGGGGGDFKVVHLGGFLDKLHPTHSARQPPAWWKRLFDHYGAGRVSGSGSVRGFRDEGEAFAAYRDKAEDLADTLGSIYRRNNPRPGGWRR